MMSCCSLVVALLLSVLVAPPRTLVGAIRQTQRLRRSEKVAEYDGPTTLEKIQAAHSAQDVFKLKGLCGQVLHSAWATYHQKPCGFEMHSKIRQFGKAKEYCVSVEPDFDNSFEALNSDLCSTCGADCPADCHNGGECVCLPDRYPEGGCACPSGWGGVQCEVPMCDAVNNCSGKGTCVAPQTCECHDGHWGEACHNEPTTTFTTSTTAIPKVPCLMGPDCDPAQCLNCVEGGGHWCLKDAVCWDGEPNTKDQCPESSKLPQSLIVHDHPDPCYEKYHDCVKLAGEVSIQADNPNGGLCTAEGQKTYKAFEEGLPDCQKFFIGGYQQPIGYLIINRPYTEIHDSLDNLNTECSKKE